MGEQQIGRIMEMISLAGLSRAKYLEAVREVRKKKFDRAQKLMEEGEECFGQAHEIHSEFLESGNMELLECGSSDLNLILVHAEDQMMCAETFRVLSAELIEMYREMVSDRSR